MTRSKLAVAGFGLLLACSISSCATVAGTAVSPLTGGVDLIRETGGRTKWYGYPFIFIGGTIAGPFVAFYNGLQWDFSHFNNGSEYWEDFEQVFRPFNLIKAM